MTTARSARLSALPAAQLAVLVPALAACTRVSPNQNARPLDVPGIACVVLHATADEGNEAGAESWMCDAVSQVSAHLHIRRDGHVTRLVDDGRRAWHAGASQWQGLGEVNDYSLGWEIANRNDGREPYTVAQYETLVQLAAAYVAQGIPMDAFVSHAEIALPAGRKRDPAGFDWNRFRTGVRALVDHTIDEAAAFHMTGGLT